jgi:uncharacterized protein YecE (DUF72 family)
MRVRVGTSGYSYKEWKGPFYPEDLPAREMLRFYAGKLGTVEINNTFYRMPDDKMVREWGERTPESFSFALKAPQRITHRKKLADAGEEVTRFLGAADLLGDRLGPLLFQLPPFAKKDVGLLVAFLELLPPARRAAFEFRNASWFSDDVHAALAARNAALVTADTADFAPAGAVVPTADFGYLRLRREDYVDADLVTWAERVRAQPWKEAWIFFKHEDAGAGPRLAAGMMPLVAAS